MFRLPLRGRCGSCRQGNRRSRRKKPGSLGAAGHETTLEKELLSFLLFLLSDADLKLLLLRFLVRLVVMTGHGIFQVLVNIGVLRQDNHYSETLVAGRAKGPKAPDVRDCHMPLV